MLNYNLETNPFISSYRKKKRLDVDSIHSTYKNMYTRHIANGKTTERRIIMKIRIRKHPLSKLIFEKHQ